MQFPSKRYNSLLAQVSQLVVILELGPLHDLHASLQRANRFVSESKYQLISFSSSLIQLVTFKGEG